MKKYENPDKKKTKFLTTSKDNIRLLSCLITAALLCGSHLGLAASADDFRTTEYRAMGPLDQIHAAEAYAKGYSGQGVRLGIIDSSVRAEHPNFAGKSVLRDYTPEADFDWNDYSHGSFVAGIMLADKDEVGMHGVAYRADLLSDNAVDNRYNPPLGQAFAFFAQYPEVKVINASFGDPFYLLEIQSLAAYGSTGSESLNTYSLSGISVVQGFSENPGLRYLSYMSDLLKQDHLLVFAQGNSGFLSTFFPSEYTFYDTSIKNNIIGVISCNQPGYTALGGTNGVSYFSNMALFTEDQSLTAPGMYITSTDAAVLNAASMKTGSGTSAAAPLVTGTLGLVQEAYPYLTAKQLGDVVLSTADPIVVNKEKATFTAMALSKDDGSIRKNTGLNLICYDDRPRPTTETQWKSLIIEALNITEADYLKYAAKFNVIDQNGQLIYENLYFYNNMPATIIFGQGLLNADKATNGVGSLNAKRLSSTDLDTTYARGVGGSKVLAAAEAASLAKTFRDIWSRVCSIEVCAPFRLPTLSRPLLSAVKLAVLRPLLLPGYGQDQDQDLADRQAFYRQYGEEAGRHSVLTGKSEDIEAYIAKYNAELEANPLLGLHVGLYKEGTGILRLSGNNTYQGANVAAGGLLQIDGSVTGDAYSTDSGTLGGVGTISGDVYNDNLLMPGSYDVKTVYDTDPAFSLGTLKIGGDLTSTAAQGGGTGGGTGSGLAIAVDGSTNSKIQVAGTASLSQSKIVPVTGYLPVPGNTYKYLTAGNITGNVQDNKINDVMTLTGSLGSSSGLSTASFTAESSGLDSVGSLNGAQTSMLQTLDQISLNVFAKDAASAAAKTLLPLYYAENSVIRRAGIDLAAEERTKLLKPSPLTTLSSQAVSSRLDTFTTDSTVKVDYKVPGLTKDLEASGELPLTLDAGNHLWMQIFRGYQADNGNNGLDNNTLGGVIGCDKNLDPTSRLGGFASYGKTNYTGSSVEGQSYDWRLGLYGSKISGDWDYQALLSYGRNRYDLDHDLGFFGVKENAAFKAKVWDGNIKARYTLPHTRDKIWQIRPYGQLSYTHTAQDAYTESSSGGSGAGNGGSGGNSLFAQSLDAASHNSWRAEAGVEFKRNLDKNCTFNGSLGYKRVLSGADPELNGSFLGDQSNRFTLKDDGDKNYLTYSLAIRGSLGGNWTGNLGFNGEFSSHTHSEVIGVMAKYSF